MRNRRGNTGVGEGSSRQKLPCTDQFLITVGKDNGGDTSPPPTKKKPKQKAHKTHRNRNKLDGQFLKAISKFLATSMTFSTSQPSIAMEYSKDELWTGGPRAEGGV